MAPSVALSGAGRRVWRVKASGSSENAALGDTEGAGRTGTGSACSFLVCSGPGFAAEVRTGMTRSRCAASAAIAPEHNTASAHAQKAHLCATFFAMAAEKLA